MNTKTQKSCKPGRNVHQHAAAIARRASSAADTHGDRRTKRNRDRSSAKRHAIKDAS